MAHPAFEALAHRPFALPRAPWVMRMRWLDLALLHWPVPAAVLRPHVPAALELDEHGGAAWIAVVPFRMAGVRARWLPPLPGTGSFAELNVRTYVRHRGVRGVWFFSLDAESRLAVRAARASFRLPYFDARMSCRRDGDRVHYHSERYHRGAPPAAFAARWWRTGAVTVPLPDTLTHWFVERYALFTTARDGSLRIGHIHHAPWQLMPATAELERCDMTRLCGLDLRSEPLFVHAALPLDVVAWAPRRVR